MSTLSGLLVGKTVLVVLMNGGEATMLVVRVTEEGLFGTFPDDGKSVFVPKHAIAAIEY